MDNISTSETDTAKLAAELAKTCDSPRLICLYGDLGAGKSLFARAFIQSLCGDDTEVPSPTFTLVQSYDTPKGPLYHYDLYRLEDPEEIYELNWDEALAEGIILLEWPERMGSLLPATRTDVRLSIVGSNKRKIEIHDQQG